jgi:F-type H+-transporting ATPase subunit b
VLINWFTVTAQIFNFLVLVYLLKRFLYKPIVRAMDERERRIASRLEEAEKREEAARQEQDQYEEKKREIDDQRKLSEKNSSAKHVSRSMRFGQTGTTH